MKTYKELRLEYLDTLEVYLGCTLCGERRSEGALCCGEPVGEFIYDDGSSLFTDHDFTFYFERWLESRPEPMPRERDPMTLAKDGSES